MIAKKPDMTGYNIIMQPISNFFLCPVTSPVKDRSVKGPKIMRIAYIMVRIIRITKLKIIVTIILSIN